MTREEAKEWIVKLISAMKEETSGMWAYPQYKDEVYEALSMANEALSVELQDHTDEKYNELMKQYKHLRKYASDLETKLSVEQTEWISVKEAYTKGEWLFEPTQNINNPWKCSCCGHRAGRYKYKTYKFCPWCGAKMDKGE